MDESTRLSETGDDGEGGWVTAGQKRSKKKERAIRSGDGQESREQADGARRASLPLVTTGYKIPKSPEGFQSAYALSREIEKEHSNWSITFKYLPTGEILISPKDEAATSALANLTEVSGRRVNLQRVEGAEKGTKMVLQGWSTVNTLDAVEEHPQVISAERCTWRKENTRQVVVTLRGPALRELDLGMWGTFPLRTFVPDPMRCFRCQQYGHHQRHCRRSFKCGICSGPHTTDTCISKHKKNEETTAKCPNCGKTHHAWSLACGVRRDEAKAAREVYKAREDYVPAPPRPSVWKHPRQPREPRQQPPTPSPALTEAEFPGLPQRPQFHNGTKNHSPPAEPPVQRERQPAQALPRLLTFQDDELMQFVMVAAAALARHLGSSEDQVREAASFLKDMAQAMVSIKKCSPATKPSMSPSAAPGTTQVTESSPTIPSPAQPPAVPSTSVRTPEEDPAPSPVRAEPPTSDEPARKGKAGAAVKATLPEGPVRVPRYQTRREVTLSKAGGAAVDPPIECGEDVEVLAVRLHFPHVYNIYKAPVRGHLDLGEVCTVAEDEQYIIAGDFNAHHPILHSVSPTNSSGRHIDEILNTSPGVVLLNDGSPTHVRHGRLDLSFVSSSLLHRMSWSINDTATSDHFGIDMSLTVAPPPPVVQRIGRWNPRKANWTLFKDRVAREVVTDALAMGELDDAEASLVSAIHAAAEEVIPKKGLNRRRHRDGWYYNQEIKDANHRVNRLRKILRRHHNPANLANLRSAVEEAKETARRVRSEKWLEWCQSFSESTTLKELWGKLHIATSRTPPRRAPRAPQCEAENLAQEFARRTHTATLPVELQQRQAMLREPRETRIQAAMGSPGDTDTPFTIHELQASRKRSSDTAPGSDLVTYSMVAHLGDAGEEALLQVVNSSWSCGRLPSNWKRADIVPIPKPREPGKYRPISLTSCLGKTMEKMVLQRLLWKLGPPQENLYGFTKGVGTAQCITTLLSHVEQRHAMVVFFDLEKAFELASPAAILDSLAARGVQGKLLQWIADYLSNRTARVRLQGVESCYHPLENGTPQGGVLSPTLFNVLMSALIAIPLPTGCRLLSYADDVALVVAGRRTKARRTQMCLDRISSKCEELGLKISPPKTKAMCFGTSVTPRDRLLLQGHEVEWVSTHMYLGVWLDSRLSFRTEVAYIRGRVLSRINVLKSLATREAGANCAVLRTFYVSAIRPVIDYASSALAGLSATRLADLETVQNQALRVILGAPRWTLVANMQQEAGLVPISVRISGLVVAFAIRVIQREHDSFLRRRLISALQQDPDLFPQKRWSARVAHRIRDLHLHDLILQKRRDVPVEGYVQSPPWENPPARISVMASRRGTPLPRLRADAEATMRSVAQENCVVYFTDGSVDPVHNVAGAAFVTKDEEQGVRVLGTRCSTQAEGVAVGLALTHALNTHQRNVVVHTDSLALLQLISKNYHTDQKKLMTSLLFQLKALRQQGRSVVLNWVPGHIGIQGNEAADRVARRAATGDMEGGIGVLPSRTEILAIATRAMAKRELQSHRNLTAQRPSARWYQVATAYERLTPGVRLSRIEEVTLHRLRLGYRCFSEVTGQPEACIHCGEAGANGLDHYVALCPATRFLRAGPRTSAGGLIRRLTVSLNSYRLGRLLQVPPPR
ncbi:uncharacterized protein LOC143032075 [Oratosquilla oratoria]|uniref:uncharacterized protein LOC143032075 n=1 Tax=Oratosquilla oratoria TaxID=337810 RepID=UPI003F76BD22